MQIVRTASEVRNGRVQTTAGGWAAPVAVAMLGTLDNALFEFADEEYSSPRAADAASFASVEG